MWDQVSVFRNRKPMPKGKVRERNERIVGVLALAVIVAAWFVGRQSAKADLMPAIEAAIPEAGYLQPVNDELFAAWDSESQETLLGYVALGEAVGYGGPLTVAVGVDPQGVIIGSEIALHKETPAWMQRVLDGDYIERLVGKSYDEPFVVGEDVDAVTGATISSRGLAQAVLRGSHSVASYVGLPIPAAQPVQVQIAVPEIVVVLLFAVGYVAHRPQFKHKRVFRWGSLLVGMVVLGFIFNRPLTISYFSRLLLGFLPTWQTNLYWFLLLGGILFVFTVDNKNPYCEWFCPFGAAQECLGAVGGAKVRAVGRYRGLLKWTQRGLAWGAIVLALLYRNPGLTSYEIFGTFFKFIGSGFQFVLLGIILFASLFIKRPWCTFLCPVDPAVDFIKMVRKWVLESWRTGVGALNAAR